MTRSGRRPSRLAAIAVLGGAVASAAAGAAAADATARVGAPARIALAPAAAQALPPDAGAIVTVSLAAYEPADEGFVSAEVAARGPSGETVALGAFSVFPNAPFGADDPASGMSFAFPLAADDLARLGGAPSEIVVRLEPVGGAAPEATMTIGGVEIRPR
ncbi:hypothetical protein [Salinarimonas sp.]|uniref:hypothetical protein n=1 Tax=Salinarimonas sp. TaxID=2766526 RepID=UPI0032D8D42B